MARSQQSRTGPTHRPLLAAVIAVVWFTLAAQAQTITVLHSFTGHGDGSLPVAGVTLDRAGNLYGTTSEVDSGGPGTVYKLSHAGSGWVLNTLYSFGHPNDPTKIYAGVVFGPDGALYGTGYDGGANTLGAVYLASAAGQCLQERLLPVDPDDPLQLQLWQRWHPSRSRQSCLRLGRQHLRHNLLGRDVCARNRIQADTH